MRTTSKSALIAVMLAGFVVAAAPREGLTWFDDYEKACATAVAQARPMLVVFDGVSSPVGVKDIAARLETSSAFRKASQRYVLGRVEGFRISQVKALEWYLKMAEPPAGAIVGPDGKPVKTYSKLPPADELAGDMTGLLADMLLKEADRSAGAGEDRRAVGLYWEVMALKPSFAAVEHARRSLADAGRRGMAKLPTAEALISAGEYLKAKKYLEEITKDYAGTDAGRVAADRIDEMRKDTVVAAELTRQEHWEASAGLLEKARRARDEENYEEAKTLYTTIIEDYAETPAAKDAKSELAKVRKITAAEVKTEQKKMDEDCRRWMSYGDTLVEQDRLSKAIEYYKKIVEAYPDSAYAAIAKRKLAEIE